MPATRPQYDHATKLGNEGDLFKHAVLSHLIGLVASDGAPFVYAETNAGRPLCVLPEGGAWRRGVGDFAESQALTQDDRAGAGRFAILGTYRALCVGRELRTGSTYPGSTELAFRILRARGHEFQLHLWENWPLAFDDLTRHFFPWLEVRSKARVIVEQSDGYEALAKALERGERPTLVLIDPPDTDQEPRIAALISELLGKEVPFLCWTPKGGHSHGKGEPATRPQPHFAELLRSGRVGALFARWTEGWAPFCQLTLPPTLIGEAQQAATAVCLAMNERKKDAKPVWSAERA